MPDIAEYNMIHELMEQVDWTNTLLESAKDCLNTPEELQKVDTVLHDNTRVMEKARASLETIFCQSGENNQSSEN